MSGLIHKHKRERDPDVKDIVIHVRLLDRLTLAVGILGPLTDLPQIIKIIMLKNAYGVSEISYAGAALFDIPFLLYGIAHKDRAITTTYAMWLTGNLIILTLCFVYS